MNKPDLLNKLEDKQVWAAVLSTELQKREKFVLILDDMWEAFSPEEVGIPIGENAGKIILTSRSREVCNRMSCQPIIEVLPLVQKEAWDLFMEKFGRETVFAPEVEECAKSFVNECDGLPLAIITVAGSMKGVTNISRWRNALKEFKKCSKGANDMKSTVIERLKFSYYRLNDEKLQKCFLYCALFPEDYKIQKKYLIRCWIFEGLVDEMETTQDEFDEGHDLLGRLEDANLLEYTRATYRGNCVKMHDLIRDMALEITTVDGQFMVKTGAQLTDFPNEEHWSENLERVSFMKSTITSSEVKKKQLEAENRRYFRRSKFLRLVEEKITDVKKLFEFGTFPEGLFIYVHQDREVEFEETTLVGQSRKKIMETILDSLKNGTSIGVCGMGGSGKTTIVSQVNNKLLQDSKTYGHVYWVTVAADSDIHKLQDKIAKVLNKPDLLNELEDKQVRAAELSAELKKREKFVLILDDMWKAFPPEDVGIPIGENAGKIILTSRSREVCNRMSCQQIIPVVPLVQEDAWDLFMEKFGRKTVFAPEVEECAMSFVNECDGLPLAIITVAGSMRGVTNIRRWRTALKEFKECSKGANDMKCRVNKRLKFSYDRLNDKKLQQCFLYCALFPEDYNIQEKYLIRCWVAEGLVDEMKTTQDEFDKGHDLLGRLKDVYLLESTEDDIEGGNCVKMHDLIRDMALEITTVDGQFMVNAGLHLTDFPNEEHWSENLERVSLMESTITRQLSSISPQCPKLCTLILQSIRHMKEIPNSLFLHLRNLRVLDMSYLIKVVRLPDSISDLEKLQVLLLRGCEDLRYVPSLAKLTELRELDLRDTNIEELPHGLEKLVNLKSLLLQFVISDEEQVKEISSLEQLEVLYVSFGNFCLFNSYVRTQPCCQRRLRRYLLGIGGMDGTWMDEIYCRNVDITNTNLIGGVEDPLVLPTNMQEFSLESCEDLTSLSDISSSLKNAKELERCRIQCCKGIEQLWSLEEDCTNTDTSSLQSLRTLMLELLVNLRVIFNFKGGRVGGCGTFSNLKLLIVVSCYKLKYVFTQGLVQHHLQSLEIIRVSFCNEMENIIVAEDEENQEEEIVVAKEEEVTCPNLKRLVLGYLPKLKSIWRGKMVCPSLQQIEVEGCEEVKRLPLSRHSQTLSTLQQIKARQEWWDLLEWDHLDAKSIFQTRFVPFQNMEGIQSPYELWKDDLERNYEEYY